MNWNPAKFELYDWMVEVMLLIQCGIKRETNVV